LENRVTIPKQGNPAVKKIQDISHLPQKHLVDKYKDTNLTTINNKPLFYNDWGSRKNTGAHIVFVHGLGGTNDSFTPLIETLELHQTHRLSTFDFEGHGLSPTSPLRQLSIESLAEDLNGVFEHAHITSGATLVAHSMGCVIAVQFALSHPEKVSKLVLLCPPATPLPQACGINLHGRQQSWRTSGMVYPAQAAMNGVLESHATNPLALTAVKLSLLGQDPEGYAKAYGAWVHAKELNFGAVQAKTLILTGSKGPLSTPKICEEYATAMQGRARVEVLDHVGEWPIFEDCASVATAVDAFLKEE
jgi:pimeloyl-ACP methyl ester carboxylesterase